MKKLLITSAVVFISVIGAYAQKYAYVDTDYILSNIPEYKSAQSQIDNLSVQWQKEIETKYAGMLEEAIEAGKKMLAESQN